MGAQQERISVRRYDVCLCLGGNHAAAKKHKNILIKKTKEEMYEIYSYSGYSRQQRQKKSNS